MKYEEAQAQVDRLIAAIGGNVDAYEEEPLVRVPEEAPPSSFEAAQAALEAATRRFSSPEKQPFYLTTTTPFPSVPTSTPKVEAGDPAPKEEAAPSQPEAYDDEDLDFCATGTDLWDTGPAPLGPLYAYLDIVENLGSLHPIWQAFEEAHRTGKAVPANLKDRRLEMTYCDQTHSWQIRDTLQGLWYLQETQQLEQIRTAELGDLFVWIQPLSEDPDVLPKGYLHNGYAFRRK